MRGVDTKVGPDAAVIEYREDARPTILRAVPDHDLPCHGRFWIERSTGRLVRSELRIDGSDTTITTSFRFDERLKTDVPLEMHEQYSFNGAEIRATATYRNF